MTTKHLLPLAATAASTLLLVTSARAQQPQASFALNDGVGAHASGSYAAGASLNAAPQPHWVITWTMSPASAPSPVTPTNPGVPQQFTNQTVRQIMHTSCAGTAVRVELSNLFGGAAGTTTLNIGAAHIAQRAVGGGANVVAGTDQKLTFNGGASTVAIPAGTQVLSDPVNLTVGRLADLAVSVYLPDTAAMPDFTTTVHQTNYVALAGTGDVTGTATFPTTGTMTFTCGYLVTGIQVLTGGDTPGFVAFGDSITEGYASTTDLNHRWPDFFKSRFYNTGKTAGVANQGIGGSKVLIDGVGPAGITRFNREVVLEPNVTIVAILHGINDIGSNMSLEPTLTADQLIAGYRQYIAMAHSKGIKAIGGTMLPFKGAAPLGLAYYYSADKDVVRIAANNWIRTSAEFDGLIDYDVATGSPGDPLTLNPAYDSGDHLHPNDTGYEAMANAIDLRLFNGSMTLTSVVSRKTHGSAGTFDLPLAPIGSATPTVESRSGGSSGSFSLVFKFTTPVVSVVGVNVTGGIASVASSTINSANPNELTVNLTGVADGQYVTVGLTNVTDGTNTSSVRATMGVLVGDTGGNGSVNAADVAQTRSLSGQSVTVDNYRSDINLDGVINAADLAFVKSRSGTSLPANANP